MKKRLIYGFLVLGLGINLFFGTQIFLNNANAAEEENAYDNIETFIKVLETVRTHYVDGEKVSYKQLLYSALKGMIASLDPHSEFMVPNKYSQMKSDTQGAFGGIGVIIGVRTNNAGITSLTVIEPMDDTPASRAGIVANDRIIKIGDKSTKGFTIQDAVEVLRGRPGSTVNVTVARTVSDDKVREFAVDLKRAVIKVASVRDMEGYTKFPVDENGIGYVRLWQFGERTSTELERALRKMEGRKLKALILDLRDNPGGLLDQAVEVCEKFLPRGQLIVFTEARHYTDRGEYKSSGKNPHPEYPIAVLVNHGSASASEIVAGCLQDLERAMIIGVQTFGKGSVQSILPLGDGSALRLTTAKYYTPSHKVIHEKGISPDIVVSMTEEQERLVAMQRSLDSLDYLNEDERVKVREAKDPQLERARDMLKGLLMFPNKGKSEKKITAEAEPVPSGA
jgi:carboxyl-terminal processing protease